MATKLRILFILIWRLVSRGRGHEAATQTYWRLVVVVFAISVCSEAIFLVVIRVARYTLVGMNLLDMAPKGLVGHGWGRRFVRACVGRHHVVSRHGV